LAETTRDGVNLRSAVFMKSPGASIRRWADLLPDFSGIKEHATERDAHQTEIGI